MTTSGSAASTLPPRCAGTDPTSVEARFGVRNCQPELPDSFCDYVVPPWAVDDHGRVRAGALAVAVDHVLGEVGFLRRPPGHWSLTAELTLDLVGATVRPDEVLRLTGSPVRLERHSGFATGTMSDSAGNPVVMATTRTVNVPAERGQARDSSSPLPVSSSAASLEDLLRVTYRSTADGISARLAEPATWTNGFGVLHGGVWACLAEMVAAEAISSANRDLATAHVHTSYLRPGVPAAGITVRASVVRVGRRFALTQVSGYTDDGTLCTVSTVTARHIEPPVA
ncbi:MAG: hotdog fold thioesterase [Mycobacterium kyogaense]|uniref:PaaI family thioesterase n=1 Tax=Mycobacterium kyogaense TaxID=2212479 RepID=UPI002FF5A84F